MREHYDVLTIGAGPAGMAVSIMAAEMGLTVTTIERRALGGECMNVGCIPSKSLLRMAKTRHAVSRFPVMELQSGRHPDVARPFHRIRNYLKSINDTKTVGMFDKVELVLREGEATFVDPHTVRVGERLLHASRIFIATGTQPFVPPIPGLADIDYLTNENMFDLDSVPESMLIIGGGAIGCEMAQAFSRLGCTCTIIHLDDYLIPTGDPEAGALLEQKFKAEGIDVYNKREIASAERNGPNVVLTTKQGERLSGQRLLLAAGRRVPLDSLGLDKAGVAHTPRGITVDKHLRTTARHIFAVGDCNGHHLLSHAAMHQGMIALMNSMIPRPFKRNFRDYVVPWTVFSDPQVSQVGKSEKELREKGIAYETIRADYADYGAAIAEAVDTGFVKVFASKWGKIYGVVIVGEGSGEMINEWALAIQSGIRLHRIMMLQHSFPTMGFLSKRIGEIWMMNRMKQSSVMRAIARFMFRV